MIFFKPNVRVHFDWSTNLRELVDEELDQIYYIRITTDIYAAVRILNSTSVKVEDTGCMLNGYKITLTKNQKIYGGLTSDIDSYSTSEEIV